MGLDPFVTAEEGLYLFCSIMDVDPVPDDRQRALDLTVQQPEEVDDVLRLRVSVVVEELEVEAETFTARADRYGADRGDAIMPSPALLNRRLTSWRERSAYERRQHEA